MDAAPAKRAADDEEIRRQSKLMFGSGDRLAVALAVSASRDGVVNATDLSWDLHLANNRVRAQLLAMRDLGLLQEDPTRSGKRWFIRIESPFWSTCVDLYAAWSRGRQ